MISFLFHRSIFSRNFKDYFFYSSMMALTHAEYSEAVVRLFVTIFLGVYFTILQAFEYIEASFTIADSIYGSTFFVATGFHGLHVLIGTTFLLICFIRLIKAHFSPTHHFGFEAAAWY
ncbi:cytochrome c oxidase subunit 3 [Armadillidium vulgare]|nr:cytochrome c oxidase subunit 3 [Armadillidium vulgare]